MRSRRALLLENLSSEYNIRVMTHIGGEDLFLGIDGGATKTVAIVATAEGKITGRIELGPANQRLMSESELVTQLRAVATALPRPIALGICLAGGWEEKEWASIRKAANKVWPDLPCYAGNDLEAALAAAEGDSPNAVAQVLVLSGTGSCCYGKTRSNRTEKVGGWGHILGDQGSAYDIGLQALRVVAASFDRGAATQLGSGFLRALQLNTPHDLISWAQNAGKRGIAALAPEVLLAASRRDRLARELVEEAAQTLAADAVACARKLVRRNANVQFVFSGSMLTKQSSYRLLITRHIQSAWRDSTFSVLRHEGAWGAVRLAIRAVGRLAPNSSQPLPASAAQKRHQRATSRALSPTEPRNPRSMALDRMKVEDAVRLMLSEDQRIPRVLLHHTNRIARIIRLIAHALASGGRLFYVGAGTSGRLGVLDASECPPTFQTDPEQVQGIMAGGHLALWSSIEGGEDDLDAGARAIEARGVLARDVVIGIAASGTTPFVWGALGAAKHRHATTVLVCFNPFLKIPRAWRPDVALTVNVGPEILTGSTRLKAGTATKLLLNMFTTLAMVRLKKVVSNLMVEVNPANAKLRERALRILQDLTGAERSAAEDALRRTHWQITAARRLLAKGTRNSKSPEQR